MKSEFESLNKWFKANQLSWAARSKAYCKWYKNEIRRVKKYLTEKIKLSNCNLITCYCLFIN